MMCNFMHYVSHIPVLIKMNLLVFFCFLRMDRSYINDDITVVDTDSTTSFDRDI